MNESTEFTTTETTTAEPAAEAAHEDTSSSAWDAAWDGEEVTMDDGEGEPAAEEPVSEEPEADESDESEGDAEDDTQAEKQGAENQRYQLKHLKEVRDVSLDELIELGQKGLDYDRVKQTLTDLRAGKDEQEREYGAFLKELADAEHVTIEELIDSIRAADIAKREGLDEARALDRVQYERRIRELEKQKSAGDKTREKQEADEARKLEFAEFAKSHPGVKADDIPAELWGRIRDGLSISDAWDIHEANTLREEVKRLKAEAEAREQKKKNAARTTGSRNTSGTGSHADAWDKFWDTK